MAAGARGMFESDRPVQYERVYQGLLEDLAKIDISSRATGLGAIYGDGGMEIPFLGRPFLVSPQGVMPLDGASNPVTIRIVLCYYVLHGGDAPLGNRWVAYRDFKDSAFFMQSFRAQVEARIAKHFTGRKEDLRRVCEALGGQDYEGPMKGDLCMRFAALPKVPLLLIFYDGDEDLPASATVLFDANAHRFLDMECLAVLGWILADALVFTDPGRGSG